MSPQSNYGAWNGGRDPLEAPFDIRQAVDEIGESVLSGMSPRAALERLMRRGMRGNRGLDALRQQVRQRGRQLRSNNRLDGTLKQVKELLEQALTAERTALFPDPDDSARLAEAELDNLPHETSRAVRELADYQWRSDEARQKFDEIQNLLRSEMLDSQFAGLKQSMANASPQDLERIRQMMSSLNDMLDADARGEHTQEQFDQFMEEYGEFFPENPQNLEELIDELARRSAAAQRLMNSLTPQQRAELGDLMANMLGQAGLADEMARLQQGLRSARPDLSWSGRERMSGDNPMGYSDATEALAELADLDQLDELAAQNYPGASLADIDDELVERALGRSAIDDIAQLRRIERELQRQGYVDRGGQGLTLTPRALRRLGSAALRRVFADIRAHGRGSHDMRDAGPSGDITGASRTWEFGDEQPLDVTRTVRNAVLRGAEQGVRPGGERGVRLLPDDFEVAETERRGSAAIALLVDMSFSMELRGFWGEAKTTALALHALITTKYPQDHIQIIGFSDYARAMTPNDLIAHEWERVQGTNLQHGLMLARRHLDRHRNAEPVIMVVTDGEPTAHIGPGGFSEFSWPPTRETIAATIAEVARCTRRGATINVFMLDDEPALVDFMGEVGRRNGGRLFLPKPGRLGEFVVADYLQARGGRRRRAG
jgi:uncharacterized protein with von Willebrand factor type A (vWA) domain